MTQKQYIIMYLRQFDSITPMQAFADLGITKLATRIGELKKDGYNFKTEIVTGKNRFGKITRYARYSLV